MTDRLAELREFVSAVDGDLQRTFPFEVQEVRDSGAAPGVYSVKGLAAVFGKWSLDLGGFRERVHRHAFDNVLSDDPHVLHVWDHDQKRSLSSTRSKEYPLELRTVPGGLHFYSRVAPTSYAADLRVLLEGGVIDQSSFAFTVKRDEWKWISDDDGENERAERTILEIEQLFDVTTCAMGAYPSTSSVLAVRSILGGRSPTGVYFSGLSLSPDPVPSGPQPGAPDPQTREAPGPELQPGAEPDPQPELEPEPEPDLEPKPEDAPPPEKPPADAPGQAAEDVAPSGEGGEPPQDDLDGEPEPETSDEERARELAAIQARVRERQRKVRERAYGLKGQ